MIDKNTIYNFARESRKRFFGEYAIGFYITVAGLAILSVGLISYLSSAKLINEISLESTSNKLIFLLYVIVASFFIHHIYYKCTHRDKEPNITLSHSKIETQDEKVIKYNDEIKKLNEEKEKLNKKEDSDDKTQRVHQIDKSIKYFSAELDKILSNNTPEQDNI